MFFLSLFVRCRRKREIDKELNVTQEAQHHEDQDKVP